MAKCILLTNMKFGQSTTEIARIFSTRCQRWSKGQACQQAWWLKLACSWGHQFLSPGVFPHGLVWAPSPHSVSFSPRKHPTPPPAEERASQKPYPFYGKSLSTSSANLDWLVYSQTGSGSRGGERQCSGRTCGTGNLTVVICGKCNVPEDLFDKISLG